MKPAEAITAATLNSAYALKLGHRIGSLEAGKQADLIILNVATTANWPTSLVSIW